MKSEGKKQEVVYLLSKASRCYRCDRKLVVDEIVVVEHGDMDKEVLCQNCAGLADLKVLRSGDAKATRLAKKYSKVQFVVVKWSELWKTYERQGILVEADALERAKSEAGST